MQFTRIKENKTLLTAAISGLCAAIAAYLLVGIVMGFDSNGSLAKGAQSNSVGKKASSSSRVEQKVMPGHVIAALPITDFALLKPRLKRGTRINVIGVESESTGKQAEAHTILSNIEVIDIPASNSTAMQEQASGLLVMITEEESERLFGFLGSGTIRVVVIGGKAK